jgi:hypothetical protein
MTPEVETRRQSQRFMVAVGCVALAVGILIYVFDRPATAVYFVPDSWQFAEATPLLFGSLSNYLPAFLHALAFALFIVVIAGRRHMALMCIGWFVAELFFELAQLDSVAAQIAAALPDWFGNFLILENVSSHFLTGRFDRIDVLFLMLGCATAYMIACRALFRLNTDGPSQLAGASRPARLAALLLVALVGLTSIVSSGGSGETSIAMAEGHLVLSQK